MAQQIGNNFQHPEQQDTGNVVEQWRIDIEEFVSNTHSPRPSSSRACIFRVPKLLKDIKRKSYVPQMVSLGPLHWKTLATQMHDHKVEAVAKMLKTLDKDINFVVEKIRELEDEIRSCYNEDIKCDGETLAWMMTFDGCFLLEFVRTISKKNASQRENFEPISIFAGNSIQFVRGYVVLGDIMMLENQIPLCVLLKLLQLELDSGEQDARQQLCDWAYRCLMKKASPFKFPHRRETPNKLRDELNPQLLMKESKHLLDFWRLCMICFLKVQGESQASCDFWRLCMESFLSVRRESQTSCNDGTPDPIPFNPSAKALKSAGIEIKACTSDKFNEIRFVNKGLCGAALFLPPLLVSSTTEIVIRNLMALEECRASPPNQISRYIRLMDSLINAREDVSLLIKNGVVDSRLGSEKEVVDMFNSLCKGITFKPIPEFDEMLTQVKQCCNNILDSDECRWWHRRGIMAEIYEKTLASPCLLLSSVVAIVYLGMSAAQTYYAARK